MEASEVLSFQVTFGYGGRIGFHMHKDAVRFFFGAYLARPSGKKSMLSVSNQMHFGGEGSR